MWQRESIQKAFSCHFGPRHNHQMFQNEFFLSPHNCGKCPSNAKITQQLTKQQFLAGDDDRILIDTQAFTQSRNSFWFRRRRKQTRQILSQNQWSPMLSAPKDSALLYLLCIFTHASGKHLFHNTNKMHCRWKGHGPTPTEANLLLHKTAKNDNARIQSLCQCIMVRHILNTTRYCRPWMFIGMTLARRCSTEGVCVCSQCRVCTDCIKLLY